MLIVDFEATRARISDRCVAVRRVATKYGLNETTLQKYVKGQLYGASGQGEYGKCENALMEMGLLVFTFQREEKPRKAA